MTNKYRNKCSSLISREMQIKPQWDITTHLWGRLCSKNQNTSVGEDREREKRNSCTLLAETITFVKSKNGRSLAHHESSINWKYSCLECFNNSSQQPRFLKFFSWGWFQMRKQKQKQTISGSIKAGQSVFCSFEPYIWQVDMITLSFSLPL